MSADLTAYAVELFIGSAWTNITADVILAEEPMRFRYGLAGNSPLDRVADVGVWTFAVDNSTGNSAGTLGYYSPLHANVRTGFTYGIPARVSLTYGGVTYYKFRGRIRDIEPVPGLYRQRITRITVVDWMEQAAIQQVRGVSLQLSQRSDQVFAMVLADIPIQPAAALISAGRDTFTYALDNLGGDRVAATSLFQDIAQSELGFIYVRGDTIQGETLVFENRQTRMATTTNSLSLNDDMLEIRVPSSLETIVNRVEVVIASRAIDATATTVLFSLPTPQSAAIAGNDTITLWGDYRDPAGKATWVGGTAMVAPVATTDYTMNTAADGSGSDLTANCTVRATYFASAVKLTITNGDAGAFNPATFTSATFNTASATPSTPAAGYLTKVQCRGKGLYRYDPETFRSDETVSQSTYGLRPTTIPMTYQDSHAVAQGAADYLAHLYSNPLAQVDAVIFEANASAALLTAALARDISDRIGIDETVTGVTQTTSGMDRGWYINSVEFEVGPGRLGPQITCTWGLAPSDATAFWLLETVGASELNTTTRLGYI